MPDVIQCPKCRAQLRWPEIGWGAEFKCPICGTVFVPNGAAVPSALPSRLGPERLGALPRPPHSPEDIPARRPAASSDTGEADHPFALSAPSGNPATADDVAAWRSIETGTALYALSHLLYLGGLAGALYTAARTAFRPPTPWGNRDVLVTILPLADTVLLPASWILAVVAACFWLSAPLRYGARSLGVACLVIATFTMFKLLLFSGHAGRDPQELEILLAGWTRGGVLPGREFLIPTILEVARLILMPFFVHAVARNLRAPGLATLALILGIGTGCLFALGTLLNMLTALSLLGAQGPGAGAGTGFPLLALFVSTILVALGILVLLMTRFTIRARLRGI